MDMLELREGETIVYEKKGDYWTSGMMGRQIPGVFQVTTKRLAHRNKALLGTAKENSFEIELADIESLSKCNVGDGVLKIIPTGVRVKTKDGSSYIVSVLKRNEFIQIMEENR